MNKVQLNRETAQVIYQVFAESSLPGKVSYPVIKELESVLSLKEQQAFKQKLDEPQLKVKSGKKKGK
jgi:hypothetical protein